MPIPRSSWGMGFISAVPFPTVFCWQSQHRGGRPAGRQAGRPAGRQAGRLRGDDVVRRTCAMLRFLFVNSLV